MPGGCIFISYRRGADNHSAGRLYDRLKSEFGAERLFIDVDGMPPGVDFVEHLNNQVAGCDAFLAIIGNGWIEDLPQLQNPNDFVRVEIEAALKRPQIPIIPVLVDDARMPTAEELPESLYPFVRRAGVTVRYEDFSAVVGGRLAGALRRALDGDRSKRAGRDNSGDMTVGPTDTDLNKGQVQKGTGNLRNPNRNFIVISTAASLVLFLLLTLLGLA